MKEDTRNLVDELKGLENEEVFERLEQSRNELEVAIENVEHDFNAGTIVRSANNFNVRCVHIIGRKKYNRRGAMCTDKYLSVKHWENVAEFLSDQRERGREVVAIENNVRGIYREDGVEVKTRSLGEKKFKAETTLVFGSEGNGLSEEILREADDIREIESFGSTRSVNVGVAAGIAMYEWARQVKISG